MISLFGFSLRNAFRRKGIAILAIIGVGIGVSLMVFILSSSAGANKAFSESFTESAAEITVSSSVSPMGFGISGGESSLIPKTYVARIEKIESVKSVSSRVTTFFSSEFDPVSILVGVDAEEDKKNNGPTTAIIEGRSFSKENEIIVGSALLNSYKLVGKELKIGDIIETIAPPSKKGGPPRKINLKIVGKFETGNPLEEAYIFSFDKTVREIAQIPSDKINSIVVKVNSIGNVEKVDEAIKKEFEKDDTPIQTILYKNILSSLQSSLETFSKFQLAISIFSGVAGGMSILIVMLISVIERKKEFGILKAVGWSNFNIIISILIESLTLSAIGVLFGLLIGEVGIFVSGYYLEFLKDFLFLSWQVTASVLAFGVVVGVVGGVYPAWQASKVSPIEALHNE
ncbi:MAG: ABC transporter permease [Patescibacteria group bacterium]